MKRVEWTWTEAMYTALLIATAAFLLAMCVSCIHRVEIVKAPDSKVKVEYSTAKPSCYIPEKPIPPEDPAWPSAHEDFYRRQYVHRRDFEAALQYQRDLGERDDAIVECLRKLTE